MEGYLIAVELAPGGKMVGVIITDTAPSRNFLYRGSMEFKKAITFMRKVKNVSDASTLFRLASQFGLEAIER